MVTRAKSGDRVDRIEAVSLESARAAVLGSCGVGGPVSILAGEAHGLVVAESVVSNREVPPFDNSAMDGFAVLESDCAGPTSRLKIAGTVLAGHRFTHGIEAGTAIRIMTGAPVPPGPIGICPVERTESDAGAVVIDGAVRAGDHIRRAGEELHCGDTVIEVGTVLGPVHLGLLGSVGVRAVVAHPRPRVGVLSTGDELLEAAEAGIGDSNRIMLLAALAEQHLATVDLGVVRDDPVDVAKALRAALDYCDAVITSGGVSVGERDVVRLALAEMSTIENRWMRIAIKPAKPFAFALLDGPSAPVPVFGLPGNPVAALVSFEVLALPALLQMAGRTSITRPVVRARALQGFTRRADGKVHFVAAVARLREGTVEAVACKHQGPHRLSALRDANALVVLPAGTGVPAGAWVDALVLDATALLKGANDRAGDLQAR